MTGYTRNWHPIYDFDDFKGLRLQGVMINYGLSSRQWEGLQNNPLHITGWVKQKGEYKQRVLWIAHLEDIENLMRWIKKQAMEMTFIKTGYDYYTPTLLFEKAS